MYKKTCPMCGKEFETEWNARKYCGDECYQEAVREKNRLRQKECRVKKKAKGKPKKGTLMDEYIEARNNGTHGGLTYGYWVARKERDGR